MRQSEVLVARSVVCKYERNPSRNEKVMANGKSFLERTNDRPTDKLTPIYPLQTRRIK